MRQAGFTIELVQGNLAIKPASHLNEDQRNCIRVHKPEIIAALRASESLLDDCGGHDLTAANDDRVTVHVPDFTLINGKRVSFDLDLPKVNLQALSRTSLKFMLKDDQGGGSILGKPGASVDEVQSALVRKYGDRIDSINGKCMELIMQADTEEGRKLRRLLAKEASGKPMDNLDQLLLESYRLRDREIGSQVPDRVSPIFFKDVNEKTDNHAFGVGEIIDGEFVRIAP
jgi:hypothetical protein